MAQNIHISTIHNLRFQKAKVAGCMVQWISTTRRLSEALCFEGLRGGSAIGLVVVDHDVSTARDSHSGENGVDIAAIPLSRLSITVSR